LPAVIPAWRSRVTTSQFNTIETDMATIYFSPQFISDFVIYGVNQTQNQAHSFLIKQMINYWIKSNDWLGYVILLCHDSNLILYSLNH